ncbi:MAG: RNA-directed DNA polymerase, partial [Cetobacterium sp.]
EEATKYCLKIDVKKFYPSIDNKILYNLLEKKIKDKRLLRLLKIIIFSVGDKGQPIGSLWSQYAGNYYLSGLDHHIKENYRVKYYYRYCDDIVILHSDKKYLHELRKEIQRYISENLNLTLKENWQVFPVNVRGIDFLGYRFFRNYALLRKRTAKKLKRKISKIKNKRVLSFTDVCSLNSYLGWTKHCDSYRFNQKYFEPLQGKSYYNHESEIKNIKLEVKKYE